MTKSEHTKGPWEIEDLIDTIYVSSDYMPNEIVLDNVSDNDDRNAEEIRANARLITAAPELLEALKAAINILENDPQVKHAQKYELESECEKCRFLSEAWSIIEKAEGVE